jgi:hypothetical protein
MEKLKDVNHETGWPKKQCTRTHTDRFVVAVQEKVLLYRAASFRLLFRISMAYIRYRSWGSLVNVVSDYRLYDRSSISGRGRGSSSEANAVSYPMDTGGTFPEAQRGRGVKLTTHPDLVSRSRMSRSYVCLVSAQNSFVYCKLTGKLKSVCGVLDVASCNILEQHAASVFRVDVSMTRMSVDYVTFSLQWY